MEEKKGPQKGSEYLTTQKSTEKGADNCGDADSKELEVSEEQKQAEEEEEKKSLMDYVKNLEEKHRIRRQYREKNNNILEYRPDESAFVKLDSSLKKNTALVRKLKQFTESQKDSIIKELKSLNLTKYISEVAAAIVENKLKMCDIPTAVEICCLLHERYADFSENLLESWQKNLLQKKDDKIPSQSKYRVDLRFFSELISVGLLPEKGALNTLSTQLTVLIHGDMEEHNNVTIIQSFCRHCGSDYAGLVPRKFRILSEKYNVSIPSYPTLPPEKQKPCKNLLKTYYDSIAKELQKAHRELQYTEWQNKRILHTKGELSTEKQERFEAIKASYSSLHSVVVQLSDSLDEDMCELKDHKFGGKEGDLEFTVAQEFHYDGDTSLYEDEETQQFYENLLDLRAIVPPILLRDSGQANSQAKSDEPKEEIKDEADLKVEDIEKELEQESAGKKDESEDADDPNVTEADADDVETADTDGQDNSTDVTSTVKFMFENYLQDLQLCVNRELVDKAAETFCMNYNNKRNRKRLVKTLFAVPRTRYDLLPFYSRLVATLHPCMPDLATELGNYLVIDFRHLVRKKDQIHIESKLKSVRFIGELVKFGMFSKTEALHCLKMLLFDFSHHNIDMACAFMETCGRYLYRSADSHHRTRVYLEVMMKKKAALSLDSRYDTMIENAYYYCNPPISSAVVKEVRPPKLEFIRKLLYKDLNKVTTEKVLRLTRKLNWKDNEIKEFATESLIAVWNVKYNNVHCMANLLSGLAPYHEDVAVQVVDGVLEDIRVGMDINHPKFNQRRIAMVKYLGELYNYRLVDSAVIFKTLYSFITYGVSYDENQPSPLDPQPHLFRLRLVCALLDTCGQYFDRGSSKKKLDYFLVYFQKYFWFKKALRYWHDELPFPVSIDMVVKDALESVRPKEKFVDSYLEANQKVEKLNEEFKEKLSGVLPFADQELEADDGDLPTIREQDETTTDSQSQVDEEGSSSQNDKSPAKTLSQSQEQAQQESMSDADEDEDEDEDEDDADDLTPPPDEDVEFDMKQKGPKHLACQEDDDFLAAFDKMLYDSLQQRMQDGVKVAQTDITVPLTYKSHVKKPFVTAKGSMVEERKQEEEEETPPPMKFALMTKKGNKPHFSALDLDVSKQLAMHYKEREMEEKAEKKKLKQLVLEINDRIEEEEQAALEAGKSLVPNTNREKKVKYQHPKGAPDADLIFGSGPKNFSKR